MKTELKDNIWIKGLDSIPILKDIKDSDMLYNGVLHIIYSGKTSKIPEEMLQQVVHSSICVNSVDNLVRYADYSSNTVNLKVRGKLTKVNKSFATAKESIQSACNKEFCIIYKIK